MLTLTLFVCFVCYHPTRLGQLCQGLKCHWYACILFAFRTISVVFCYEVGWISLTKEMNVALSLKLSPGELKHANLILHFPRIQDQQSQQLPVAKALLQKAFNNNKKKVAKYLESREQSCKCDWLSIVSQKKSY